MSLFLSWPLLLCQQPELELEKQIYLSFPLSQSLVSFQSLKCPFQVHHTASLL